jgi:DNA-binding transcriptional ArsR family regulator
MKNNNKLKLSKNLLIEASKKKDGFNMRSIALYAKVKTTFANGTIYGKTVKAVSMAIGETPDTIRKHLSVLNKKGIIRKDSTNMIFISQTKLNKLYDDKSVVNWIDFSGCYTLTDFEDRLYTSLWQEKINSVECAVKQIEEPDRCQKTNHVDKTNRENILKNSIFSTYVNISTGGDVNRKVNRTVTERSLAKYSNISNAKVNRIIRSEEAKGKLSQEEIIERFYDFSQQQDDPNLFEYINSIKPKNCHLYYNMNDFCIYAQFGTILKVKSTYRKHIYDMKEFYKTIERTKNYNKKKLISNINTFKSRNRFEENLFSSVLTNR